MRFRFTPLCLFCLAALTGCKQPVVPPERTSSMSSIFKKKKAVDTDEYDLASILQGGELIVTTLSGPDTYYDYHGIGMGLQYALAENFADSQGLTVRVEVAADTTELVQKLREGAADLIAYPLDAATLQKQGLVPTGYDKKGRWAVRKNAAQLAEALDDWYGDGVEVDVNKALEERTKKSHHIERRAQAVFLSRDRGVISIYDNLFKDASAVTGWDWKLIAAQCYQESAFDPNARSYVGAQGLMQLMPKTAKSLGLEESEICLPEKNVGAAAKYIAMLSQQFADVRNRDERVKFVLASYNGGSGHVRDAMALAKKYGHNPQVWDEVAPYILGLSKSEYYKDPVVKYGYMIGRETAGYVQKIMERWRDYGGNVSVSAPPKIASDGPKTTSAPAPAAAGQSEFSRRTSQTTQHTNRYTSGARIPKPVDDASNSNN